MEDIQNRRPLKVRQAAFAQKFAKWLADKDITPNQISVMSVAFALLAALSFYVFSVDNRLWFLFICVAIFIQGRLLCNLFDGMVAIEGGKTTKSGELFNDIPDRIADPLILVASGYAVINVEIAVMLGWLAGLLSVMTAYVRTLGNSLGAPADFSGPMAKQHRMAILTIACILTSIELLLWQSTYCLLISLMIIIVGCFLTLYKRIQSAYHFLEK